jgi:hypothetical protein
MARCREIPLDPPLEKGEVRRTYSGKERGKRQKSEAVELINSMSRFIFPLM